MEIQQLTGFIAVAKTGSFSKAADKTFRTQPAISLQVRSLEDELKVKLFDRLGPRKITLTEQGKIFFDLASPLLEDIDTLTSRFNEACGKKQKGLLRIATHTSVMVYLLPEVIKQFKKKFPECELQILNRSKKDIISMIKDGDADIGICSLSSVPRIIDYKVFAKFDRVLITPKKHPLSKKTRIRINDIAKYPLILPPEGSNTRSIIDEKFKENSLEYRIAMEITGRQAIKVYVGMDLGISILNDFYLTKEDRKNLFTKNVSSIFTRSERGTLTRKNRYLSKPVKEFIKIVHHSK